MAADTVGGGSTQNETVERFLDLIEGDRFADAIDLAVDRIQQGFRVTEIVQQLLAPAQLAAGQRWHDGRYTVAQEHIVSGVVDDILGLLAIHAPRPASRQTVALVCAEGEWHTTPARMAALCLRDEGWRVQFLGGSLPADHLATSLRQIAPEVVAVSCTLPLALTGVPPLVEASHRAGAPVITGGIGFGGDGLRSRRLGADGHAADPAEAAATMTAWLDRPPEPFATFASTTTDPERVTLAEQRPDLVVAAYARLEAELPAMADFDERQRHHTRADLDYILRFLDTTLLVDDPRIFTDFLTWLRALLSARGLPPAVLRRSLEALQTALPPGLDRSSTLLGAGADQVDSDPGPGTDPALGG